MSFLKCHVTFLAFETDYLPNPLLLLCVLLPRNEKKKTHKLNQKINPLFFVPFSNYLYRNSNQKLLSILLLLNLSLYNPAMKEKEGTPPQHITLSPFWLCLNFLSPIQSGATWKNICTNLIIIMIIIIICCCRNSQHSLFNSFFFKYMNLVFFVLPPFLHHKRKKNLFFISLFLLLSFVCFNFLTLQRASLFISILIIHTCTHTHFIIYFLNQWRLVIYHHQE